VTLASGNGAGDTRETHHHALHTLTLHLRGMPRHSPPQCAAHRDSQQNPHRHCRRHWLAHPSLQMTHTRYDAEEAAEYYRAPEADDSATLLPGIPPSE